MEIVGENRGCGLRHASPPPDNFRTGQGTDSIAGIDYAEGLREIPEGYEKFSPHRYVANFKTPNLIIHNALDFRVPFSEGMQLFTTLQRKGIPSKLLYFPDEGHWVNKPANSELWYRTVFEWLAEYLKGATIAQ